MIQINDYGLTAAMTRENWIDCSLPYIYQVPPGAAQIFANVLFYPRDLTGFN